MDNERKKDGTMLVDGTYYRDDGHGPPSVHHEGGSEGGGVLAGFAAVVIGLLLGLKGLSSLWNWFLGLFGG